MTFSWAPCGQVRPRTGRRDRDLQDPGDPTQGMRKAGITLLTRVIRRRAGRERVSSCCPPRKPRAAAGRHLPCFSIQASISRISLSWLLMMSSDIFFSIGSEPCCR